jgi:hypothetical protein
MNNECVELSVLHQPAPNCMLQVQSKNVQRCNMNSRAYARKDSSQLAAQHCTTYSRPRDKGERVVWSPSVDLKHAVWWRRSKMWRPTWNKNFMSKYKHTQATDLRIASWFLWAESKYDHAWCPVYGTAHFYERNMPTIFMHSLHKHHINYYNAKACLFAQRFVHQLMKHYFFRTRQSLSWSRNSSFMEPEPCPQQAIKGPSPKSHDWNTHSHTIFI